MRQVRRRSLKRPLLIGFGMLVVLYLLFGGGGSTVGMYDPAAANAARFPEGRPPSSGLIKHSIVVPCYRERENVKPLVTRVFGALRDAAAAEIVLVDDNSRDGTVEEVDALRAQGHNVRVIVRTTERGLSSAVLRGFEEALGESLVVMDADLQHPPEAVQLLFDALDNDKTPFALGTRYGPGVEMDKNWPLYRRVISWGARSLARPLTAASDPMTGFFGVRKALFLRATPLNPSGFKIALEILLKAPIPSGGIAEVPFSFGTRAVGESKLSSKVMFRYVGQLYTLYWSCWGLFFPLVVMALAGVGGAIAIAILQQIDNRYGMGWGIAHLGYAQRRMKLKSEV